MFYAVERGTLLLGLNAIRNLQLRFQGNTPSCLQINMLSPTLLPARLHDKFSHLFSGEVGLAKGFKHQIKIHPSSKPVIAKLRRLPFALQNRMSEELKHLEQSGIIECVDAAKWISPIVVQKRNGTIRQCVDLREVNKAISVDGFPLPHT